MIVLEIWSVPLHHNTNNILQFHLQTEISQINSYRMFLQVTSKIDFDLYYNWNNPIEFKNLFSWRHTVRFEKVVFKTTYFSNDLRAWKFSEWKGISYHLSHEYVSASPSFSNFNFARYFLLKTDSGSRFKFPLIQHSIPVVAWPKEYRRLINRLGWRK